MTTWKRLVDEMPEPERSVLFWTTDGPRVGHWSTTSTVEDPLYLLDADGTEVDVELTPTHWAALPASPQEAPIPMAILRRDLRRMTDQEISALPGPANNRGKRVQWDGSSWTLLGDADGTEPLIIID